MPARKGEAHHFAKLDAQTVLEARRRYAAGGTSFLNLASEYGVTVKTMQDAIKGASWGWVKNEGGSATPTRTSG